MLSWFVAEKPPAARGLHGNRLLGRADRGFGGESGPEGAARLRPAARHPGGPRGRARHRPTRPGWHLGRRRGCAPQRPDDRALARYDAAAREDRASIRPSLLRSPLHHALRWGGGGLHLDPAIRSRAPARGACGRGRNYGPVLRRAYLPARRRRGPRASRVPADPHRGGDRLRGLRAGAPRAVGARAGIVVCAVLYTIRRERLRRRAATAAGTTPPGGSSPR